MQPRKSNRESHCYLELEELLPFVLQFGAHFEVLFKSVYGYLPFETTAIKYSKSLITFILDESSAKTK